MFGKGKEISESLVSHHLRGIRHMGDTKSGWGFSRLETISSAVAMIREIEAEEVVWRRYLLKRIQGGEGGLRSLRRMWKRETKTRGEGPIVVEEIRFLGKGALSITRFHGDKA